MSKATLEPSALFASMVYTIKKPEFLDATLAVSDEMLAKAKAARPINDTYPFVMSDSMIGNERTLPLEKFIAESAWAILDNQGYQMDQFLAYVSEFWVQEHFKINVPSVSEADQSGQDWNIACDGVFRIDREASTAIIDKQ